MVRLVDHADLHIAQVAVTLLDEVGQPPGTGDDDVDPVAQGRHLRLLRRCRRRWSPRSGPPPGPAAPAPPGPGWPVHGWAPAPGPAGGRRMVWPPASAATSGIENAERLAGAGPAPAEDVPPGQRVRQRGGLDRERRGDAGLGQAPPPAARDTPRDGEADGPRGVPARCAGRGGRAGHAVATFRWAELSKECLSDSGGRIVEGRHVRGNQFAHRATYDRRALMAAPHYVLCVQYNSTADPRPLPHGGRTSGTSDRRRGSKYQLGPVSSATRAAVGGRHRYRGGRGSPNLFLPE